MTNYKLSYPAVNGEVVTEGHTNYCKTNGHATHVVDGVESNLCPRCGDNKNEISTEPSYQVGSILELEEKGVLGREECPYPSYWHWPVLKPELLPDWLQKNYNIYGEIRYYW